MTETYSSNLLFILLVFSVWKFILCHTENKISERNLRSLNNAGKINKLQIHIDFTRVIVITISTSQVGVVVQGLWSPVLYSFYFHSPAGLLVIKISGKPHSIQLWALKAVHQGLHLSNRDS